MLNTAGRPHAPLFIVGCGRSGTTMLREMINAHPEFAIPGESHFIPKLWTRRRRYLQGPHGGWDVRLLVGDILATPQVRSWDLPDDEVWPRVEDLAAPTFASVVGSVFQAYAASRGKPSWADKTPVYVIHIPLLARLFPDARFIHLIRDGRDVALSYLSRPLGIDTVWEAARRWRRDVRAGIRDGRGLGDDRYVEVHYEELVRDPQAVLEQLAAFAGVAYTDAMLEYAERFKERKAKRPDPLGIHSLVMKPPVVGARDWRIEMPGPDVAAFEAVAGPLLGELGYERRFPTISARRRVEAAVRVAGVEGRARAAREKKRVTKAVRRLDGRPATRTASPEGHNSSDT